MPDLWGAERDQYPDDSRVRETMTLKASKDKLNIETIELKSGSHTTRGKGVCVMEAVAWFAGLKHTDKPNCTDAVVTSYAQRLNDWMPDDVRQRLRPFIPRLAGTQNGVSREERALMCADRAVRVFAPLALEAGGHKEVAAALRALAPITNAATALAGKDAAHNAAIAAHNATNDAIATSAIYATTAAYAAAIYATNATYATTAAYAAATAAAYAHAWDEALRLLDDLIEAGHPDGTVA